VADRSRVFPTGSRVRLGLASDEWLVGCVRRGDTAAFEALYDRHARELLGFCVYMLGSRQDAEDAVQATFASAYRALRADGRPVALRPWLFTIARNDCLSILRRRRALVELNGEVSLDPEPAHALELREEVRRIFEGLRELPERQRAALILAEVHGLSHAEIGEVLEVRPAQVKAFIYQARSKLIADRRARDSDCREIREELAGARGAALLRGRLRRHVRSCADCRTYAAGMARQRRQLGALLPIVPSLALKYRALEGLSIGGGDPITVTGAGVGATVAGAAAEVAGGGLKALVCKLAAGVACLGAGAGVGVSVLENPAVLQGGQASAAGTTTAPLPGGRAGRARSTAGGSAREHGLRPALGAPAGAGHRRRTPSEATGALPEVQRGLSAEPVAPGASTDPDPRAGTQSGVTATGEAPVTRRGGGSPGRAGRGASTEQHRLEREARQRIAGERRKAREEGRTEGHSRPPRSEEELARKREERERKREEAKHKREEGSPGGHSHPPPSEEELAHKREARERRREERKRAEEEAALPSTAP
jgi:RNA polymerase sigma factor (sigma-70 family)